MFESITSSTIQPVAVTVLAVPNMDAQPTRVTTHAQQCTANVTGGMCEGHVHCADGVADVQKQTIRFQALRVRPRETC